MYLVVGSKGIRGHSGSMHGNGSSHGNWSKKRSWLHHQPGSVSYSIHFWYAEYFRVGRCMYCPFLQTLAVSIMASGKMFTPMLVFRGMVEGLIATQDFATYPCRWIYACQTSTWMDDVVILQWVERLLKPHIPEVPSHVIPLLLLDSCRCHMTASVSMWINELGVEVQHNPGGCTSPCQPVNVGIACLWMSLEIDGSHGWLRNKQHRMDNYQEENALLVGKRHCQKASKLPCWQSLHFSASPTKQWRMQDVIGTSLGFREDAEETCLTLYAMQTLLMAMIMA